MLETFKLIGFIAMFLRFAYWIGASLLIKEEKWIQVLIAQFADGLLVFFFFLQLFGNVHIFSFQNIFAQSVGFFLTCWGIEIAYHAKLQLGSAWIYASAYKIVGKQSLITNGVYKTIRHPLYTGIAMSYVGIELLAGSWLWISMLFFFIPFYFQAKREEKLLEKHFGKLYGMYRLRTKMLIPYLL